MGGSIVCDGDALKVHHIIPVCAGGLATEKNAAVLCVACHGRVHSKALQKKPGEQYLGEVAFLSAAYAEEAVLALSKKEREAAYVALCTC